MSHRTARRIRRGTAGTLAALAVATSPAAARPAVEPIHHDSSPASAPVQAADASTGGFEWGSGAIGAGAATVVFLLAGAGGVTASRRHHRGPRTPSAGVA